MAAPDAVLRLVDQFEQNRDQYVSPTYNETQLRQEFLNPFFNALGWDVYNTRGYAGPYKDVIHEDAIKVDSANQAPDYSFRIGGVRKFFVEAKKPAVHLKNDPAPAFQLRRYAWSAKLPISILTDFEEFCVYDCRTRPYATDKVATARIQYFTFQDYGKRWDEIASVFSQEAVLKGSFDKFIDTSKGKKGTAEVDDEFLKEIEGWRDVLARAIALRNSKLSVRELNFAVQRTIDRIIFLRICEDRGIENYGSLKALVYGDRTYKRMCDLFNKADDKYNSGLFHFSPEKGRPEIPDGLTLGLHVDDKPLMEIIGGLYYPDCPYEFSVLPADILGQVYEQFLGKVIRLTAGHQAKVEEKPEVKKAGGVYYTPTYIVDYTVMGTVGKLLEGKTPKRVATLRILDPACGSGSFLIGAYQYLLDWHHYWYTNDGTDKWSTGKNAAIYRGPGGDWRLTTAERKRILLNNIYGVDIDSQAVEVTKLSLLLKVLEGENEESINQQLKMFHERALPDLGDNIKCGNSLIGPEFYEGGQLNLLEEEEKIRINAFDWKSEFKRVFDEGGFDAMIGNPPYGAFISESEMHFFLRLYSTAKGVKDVYAFFIERALSILRDAGLLSYIVPSSWLGGPQYTALRQLVLSSSIESIVLLPFDVFRDAYIDTAIVIVSKSPPNDRTQVKTFVFPKKERLKSIVLDDGSYSHILQRVWQESEDRKFVLDPKTMALLANIRSRTVLTFGNVATIKRGILFDKTLLANKRTSPKSLRYFEGDVYRYHINMVIPNWLEFDDRLKERPKESVWFEGERILLRRLVNRQRRFMASLAVESFITNKNLYSILPLQSNELDIRFLLGILNSKLISYVYLKQVTGAVKDDFPQITITDLQSLPIIRPADESINERIISLVDSMSKLYQDLSGAKIEHEKIAVQRRIDETDKQIDALVYELYGLTEDETKVVEGENSNNKH